MIAENEALAYFFMNELTVIIDMVVLNSCVAEFGL